MLDAWFDPFASKLDDPDQVFQALLTAHDGLDADAAARFDAALILTLANMVGEVDLVVEAIRLARKSITPSEPTLLPAEPRG